MHSSLIYLQSISTQGRKTPSEHRVAHPLPSGRGVRAVQSRAEQGIGGPEALCNYHLARTALIEHSCKNRIPRVPSPIPSHSLIR